MDKRYDQFLGLLRKTREDIRVEVQRLLEDLKDPEKQQRVKESVRELGTWARHTAEDVGDLVERAVRKAEGALNDAAKRVGVKVPMPRSPHTPDSTQSWRVSRPPAEQKPSNEDWAPQAHEASPELVTDKPNGGAAPGRKTVGRKVAAKKATSTGGAKSKKSAAKKKR